MSALRLHRGGAAAVHRSWSTAVPGAALCRRACHSAAAPSPPNFLQQQQQQPPHTGTPAHASRRDAAAPHSSPSPRDSASSAATAANVAALFEQRFGKQPAAAAAATSPYASGQTGLDAIFARTFSSPHTHARRASATAHTGTTARVAPWGGLWNLTALQRSARTGIAAGPHSTDAPLHVYAPAPPPPGAQGAAWGAPHADPIFSPTSYASYPSAAAAVASSSPSPALQRYWRSYQLWQSLVPRIHSEQHALLQLRAEAHTVKAAHRGDLQRHLQHTTRWTLFLVCPLLGLLFASLVMEAAVYQVEVAQLPFVAYEDALRDFNAANGREAARQRRGARGGKSKTTRNIRID